MKTLDEVIAIMDGIDQTCTCCAYQHDCDEVECVEKTALHYLKAYRRYQNTPSRNGHMALVDYFEESQKNEPLTWDELRTMEGKPVWVEALLYKQWAVVAYVGDEHIRFEGVNLYAPESRCYMGKDDGWQAYRKEKR